MWDHFGTIIPKYRDFRQIYLACTDEGDRYSDDFMVISIGNATPDPNQCVFWGSLRKEQAKDITYEIEKSLVLNQVHQAQVIELPTPAPVAVSAAAEVAEVATESASTTTAPADSEEREPRGDCVIL
jgi:hypothetical protein